MMLKPRAKSAPGQAAIAQMDRQHKGLKIFHFTELVSTLTTMLVRLEISTRLRLGLEKAVA